MKHINKNCNHCDVKLVLGINYSDYRYDQRDYSCKACYSKIVKTSNKEYNNLKMYVNGKYVSRKHPLYKAGNFKTFEGAAFSSLKGYNKTTEGYVYIINNPCWDGWIKIGMAIDAEDRCNNYQTSSPYRDYNLYYKRFFEDRKMAEKTAHSIVSKISTKRNGEWFKINKNDAKGIINAI